MPSPPFRSQQVEAYNSSATSQIVTAPAGITDNDILVAVAVFDEDAHPAGRRNQTVTYPSGFTEFINMDQAEAGKAFSGRVAWKRAASESGNYTFSWPLAAGEKWGIFVWSGALASPIDASSTNIPSGGSNATVTVPDATALSANTTRIAIPFNWFGGAWGADPAGMTARLTTGSFAVYDQAIAATGAVGTKTATPGTASSVAAATVLLASEAPITASPAAPRNAGPARSGPRALRSLKQGQYVPEASAPYEPPRLGELRPSMTPARRGPRAFRQSAPGWPIGVAEPAAPYVPPLPGAELRPSMTPARSGPRSFRPLKPGVDVPVAAVPYIPPLPGAELRPGTPPQQRGPRAFRPTAPGWRTTSTLALARGQGVIIMNTGTGWYVVLGP